MKSQQDLVKNNPEIDVFVNEAWTGVIWCGCYAMRCKYLKEMLNALDLNQMELEMIGIEGKVKEFINIKIKEGIMKIQFVEKLDVTANIFGEGKPELTYW